MTRLDHTLYVEHLRRDSRRFRDVLATCDPAARVPACPDWDAADLLWHLAEVQWSWATIIETRPAGPPEQHPQRPASYDGLLAALDDASGRLVTALEQADPAEPAWSWADEQTVGFTFRRQAHEALVHRLDAEQTAGSVTPLDPVLAADGVAEALDVMYGGEPPAWAPFTPGGGEVRVVLRDVGISLRVRLGSISGADPDSERTLEGPHLLLVDDDPAARADAEVTGSAGDVDAWLWKRRDRTGIDLTGDHDALTAFTAATSPAID